MFDGVEGVLNLLLRPLVVLMAAVLTACALTSLSPEAATSLVAPDVTAAEWEAATPMTDLENDAPRPLEGQQTFNVENAQIPPDRRSIVRVDLLIRADGTVGVYRVISATYESHLRAFVSWLRSVRFTPTLSDGHPIAVRGQQVSDIRTGAWTRRTRE